LSVRLLARDAQAKPALIVAQILLFCPSICPCVCPRQLERSIARREPHRLPAYNYVCLFVTSRSVVCACEIILTALKPSFHPKQRNASNARNASFYLLAQLTQTTETQGYKWCLFVRCVYVALDGNQD